MSAGAQSQLKLFFLHNRDVVLKTDRRRRPTTALDAEITHQSMDGNFGGSYSIPPNLLDDFYNAYGADMHYGLPLFMTERHSEPVFVMHFDVDFKALEQPERVQAFCDLVYGTVAEYYREPIRMIVCAVVDAAGQRKPGAPGLHIIFSKVFVNREQALLLHAGVVARCHTHLPWGGDWNTILDIGVLSNRGGSLRMIGSDKCRRCETCTRNDPCTRADCHRKYIAENKIYWPWKVHPDTPANCSFSQELSNRAWAAKQCTVRCLIGTKPRADFTPPTLAPASSRLEVQRRGRSQVTHPEGGPIYTFRNEGRSDLPNERRDFEEAHLDEACRAALLRAVQAYHENYSQVVVKRDGILRSRRSDGRQNFLLKIRGFGERYCMNKQDVHRSSTVYFMIDSDCRLYAKCYCTKLDIRSGVSCADFSGPKKFLPDELYVALQGEGSPPARAASPETSRPSQPLRNMRQRMLPFF